MTSACPSSGPSAGDKEARRLFEAGLEVLRTGNTLSALVLFERAAQIEDLPIYVSYMAYGIARERGQYQLASTTCEKAIAREPDNPVLYLNLGRIYLLAGKKTAAIDVFRRGLRYGEDAEIIYELDLIGTRKPPVFPFLKRQNPFNVILGKVLKQLRLR